MKPTSIPQPYCDYSTLHRFALCFLKTNDWSELLSLEEKIEKFCLVEKALDEKTIPLLTEEKITQAAASPFYKFSTDLEDTLKNAAHTFKDYRMDNISQLYKIQLKHSDDLNNLTDKQKILFHTLNPINQIMNYLIKLNSSLSKKLHQELIWNFTTDSPSRYEAQQRFIRKIFRYQNNISALKEIIFLLDQNNLLNLKSFFNALDYLRWMPQIAAIFRGNEKEFTEKNLNFVYDNILEIEQIVAACKSNRKEFFAALKVEDALSKILILAEKAKKVAPASVSDSKLCVFTKDTRDSDSDDKRSKIPSKPATKPP